MNVRRLILLAILPGIVLPGSLAFQICFCGWFSSHEAHAGCHEKRCALHHGPAVPEGGSRATLSELNREGCYCVRVSLPKPPAGDRAPERTLVDAQCDHAVAPAAEAVQVFREAEGAAPWLLPGRDRSRLPSSNRTLPLLI